MKKTRFSLLRLNQNHHTITLPTGYYIKDIINSINIPLPHCLEHFHLPPKPPKNIRQRRQYLRLRQFHAHALPGTADKGHEVFERRVRALPARWIEGVVVGEDALIVVDMDRGHADGGARGDDGVLIL